MSAAMLVPLTLVQARRYVAEHHRHAEPPLSHKFSIGLARDGQLVGVVVASRPIARHNDDGTTIELTRLTTEGDRNACSRLYAAACRAAGAMGYRRAITFTLASEPGTSPRAAGFVESGAVVHHGGWGRDGAPRAHERMRLFDSPEVALGDKVRWTRELS